MKKTLIAFGILFLLISSVIAGVILFSGNLANVTMKVKSPTTNIFTIDVGLGELNSLQEFDSGIYNPLGKEITIQNINFDSIAVYSTNLSNIEKSALDECKAKIIIYNSTSSIIEDEIDILNETILCANNLTGDWDVSIQVYGKTGMPDVEQVIDFNIVIHLNPSEVIVLPQIQTVAIGETFDVNIYVVPHEEIAGMQFDLSFDESIIQINSITEGNLFKQSSFPTLFVSGTIDNDNGFVNDVYGNILGASSVSIPESFAVISLTALGNGNSYITLIDVKVASPEPIHRLPIYIGNSEIYVT